MVGVGVDGIDVGRSEGVVFVEDNGFNIAVVSEGLVVYFC
jgi:hypothetical protein